ncbi:MAG: prepilin peptidase [Pseudobdellovibrionaceae bacterium]|jgi:prepilin peptidase CpaA|nr:prepilin peptidase [Pseudobdellovibrionaceae bacterium]
MIGLVLFLFGVIVTLAMCGVAAVSDFRGFRIPNYVSLVILAAFAVTYVGLMVLGQADVVFHPVMNHIGAALIVFVVTLAMFALKQLGAGDSKFATVIALWVGLQGLIPFLFYMSLSGGLVAAFSLVLKRKKLFAAPAEGSWIAKAQEGHPSVPYGIALAVGALFAFIFIGYFNFSKWEAVF